MNQSQDSGGQGQLTARRPARELLESLDPLSDFACEALLHYREEDEFVDFKETFEFDVPKPWLDLAIDCAAFANTRGGYVVFGVKDKTWDHVGLDQAAQESLGDTKRVFEKVNRGLSPPIIRGRSRGVTVNGLKFAIVHVPPSLDCTHVFESNLDLGQPPKLVTMVRKGSIYVRRSGSNQVMTSVDLEQLIARRIDTFRTKLLAGITRVVTASPDQEVITVAKEMPDPGVIRYRVMDAPTSEGIEGVSLAIAGESVRDRIALNVALTANDRDYQIDDRLLFEAYAAREEQWSSAHLDWLADRALRAGLPAFAWLKDRSVVPCRELIKAVFDSAPRPVQFHLLSVSGFYGHALYERLREAIGHSAARSFPGEGRLFNTSSSADPKRDSTQATEIARVLSKRKDATLRYTLERLDCALYAPFGPT